MLLTMAGRCNSGGMIFLTENIPYTSKMLADELDFEESTVQLALNALSKLGMVSMDENSLCIPGWEEYQNIDGLEKLKEYNRIAKQKSRERLRLSRDVIDVSLTCQTEPSECQGTDKEIRNKNIESIDIMSGKPDHLSEKAAKIIARLNEKTGANYQSGTASTVRKIQARLNEGFSVEDFFTVIDAKAAEWMGSPMEQYLRPDTLFCTKFEGYLQAAKRSTSGGGVWAREEQDDLDFVK
jgi:uncharacterized phage protein (TIGR02220 family)